MTVVVSVAVPENDGVVLLECGSGWFSVTVGAVVFTVNVTGELFPSPLPTSELASLAMAVKVRFPLGSAGLTAAEVHCLFRLFRPA